MGKEVERKRRSRKVIESESGIIVGFRKIQKIANSYYVSLPGEFIEEFGLKEGDEVIVIADRVTQIIPISSLLEDEKAIMRIGKVGGEADE